MIRVQKYHAITTLVFGVCELLCGILVFILAIVGVSKADLSAHISQWWAGILVAIPGILGVVVGYTRSFSVMTAFMVFNVMAFVLQSIGAIVVAIVIAVWSTAIADITGNCHMVTRASCFCKSPIEPHGFTIKGVDNCDKMFSLFSTIEAMLVFLVISAIITSAGSLFGGVVVFKRLNRVQQIHHQPEPVVH